MMIGRVVNATRVLGKSQGYRGLPVRDIETTDGDRVMMTAWIPTPDEVAKIALGAPIHLYVMGTDHPPVKMEVGSPPAVV